MKTTMAIKQNMYKKTYFSTTELILIQASSAASENACLGWASRINSAKSATLHRESDNSSKTTTILRDLKVR